MNMHMHPTLYALDRRFAATLSDPEVRAEASDHLLAPDTYWCRCDTLEQVAADERPAVSSRMIAVVPIWGFMGQHEGNTRTAVLANQLARFDADPQVGGILLHVHSPGGQVWGIRELAGTIRQIVQGGRTRVVALADSMAASAAVWAASQAHEFFAAPGGEVGSIGVLAMHVDYSIALENEGVKMTLIAEPEAKVEANPFEPLSEETAERIREEIQSTYVEFLEAVAVGRGTTATEAHELFGGGRMLDARKAAAVNLIDDRRTLSEALRELAGTLEKPRRTRQSAVGISRHRIELELAELDD